jgi:hypothetical protein
MSNISDVLKEATKDILSEDTLKEIENVFNTSVNEKVELHVKKALTEQDEDYSAKLEKLIEAIDTDHTNKLQKVVEAIDADRAAKLKTVIEKYGTALQSEAATFKNELVAKISKYLEVYLENKVPTASINEAVKNKKATKVLENIRSILAVNMAVSNESIKDAVVDGKKQLNEAASQLEATNEKVKTLAEELATVKAELTLEKKIQELDENRKVYARKMLANKSEKFINENFDYTLGLWEKNEEVKTDNITEEAAKTATSSEVDRPIVNESVLTNDDADPSFNAYLSELKKY